MAYVLLNILPLEICLHITEFNKQDYYMKKKKEQLKHMVELFEYIKKTRRWRQNCQIWNSSHYYPYPSLSYYYLKGKYKNVSNMIVECKFCSKFMKKQSLYMHKKSNQHQQAISWIKTPIFQKQNTTNETENDK